MTNNSELARRLRDAREASGTSLRQLAQRVQLSPSALSQIETGKSRPSVRTLYALVSELNLSLDELFDNPGGAPGTTRNAAVVDEIGMGATHRRLSAITGQTLNVQKRPASVSPVQRADGRARLTLDSGVEWERLTSKHDPAVDFLRVTYAPGSSSNVHGTLVRHAGREYGLVLTGAVDVTIGFESYSCGPGDSISFNSDEPHLLANNGDKPATAIWFVVGRRESDPRQPAFED